MIFQFLNTETDAPGPFTQVRGSKFKCVVVPTDSIVGSPDISAAILASEPLLISVMPEFASYKAPTFDAFIKDDDYARVPRDWVFSHNSSKVTSFARLFTSGMNHGRPANPFHQGFICTEDDVKPLIARANQVVPGVRPRPADFAFSDEWLDARGESQVNAAEIGPNFPYPKLSSSELSIRQHFAFDSSETSSAILYQFAQALYQGGDFTLPSADHDLFMNWVSLLTHLVPQRMAWRIFFNSLGGGPARSAESLGLPRIDLAEGLPVRQVSPAAAIWASLVKTIYENYEDETFLVELDETISATEPAKFGSEVPPSRISLSAVLFTSLRWQASTFGTSEIEYADKAIAAMNELGWPVAFSTSKQREAIVGTLGNPSSLLNQSSRGPEILELLKSLPVINGV